MSNWGSFSEKSYEDFTSMLQNPTDFMVVAPALASRAASAPSSFMMDEGYEDEEEDEWDEDYEDEEEDHEANGRMAIGQLRSMAEDIALILGELSYDDQLEAWVAAKITMSKQNLSAVADYLRFSDEYSELWTKAGRTLGELD
jgi:hypothetical protein